MAEFDGADSRLALDGELVAAGNVGTQNRSGIRIGADQSLTVVRMWRGPIGEIIGYAGTLSAADIAKIKDYLADKWGISVLGAFALSFGDSVTIASGA
jgi:hypothetical protein